MQNAADSWDSLSLFENRSYQSGVDDGVQSASPEGLDSGKLHGFTKGLHIAVNLGLIHETCQKFLSNSIDHTSSPIAVLEKCKILLQWIAEFPTDV
jgi:hypothetical protein